MDSEMIRQGDPRSAPAGQGSGASRDNAGGTSLICNNDQEMMLEFSRRCVRRLDAHLPLRLLLSPLRQFLDANVRKETEKNRLIIEHAAETFTGGKWEADVDVNTLFELTKRVDEDFVSRLSSPLFAFEVRYADIEEIRKRRIVALVNMVFDLQRNWKDAISFSTGVKRAFTEQRYMETLRELLHLYTVETKMLSKSIVLQGPAGAVRDLLTEKLFAAMEKTAGDVVVTYTRKVYADNL